jgi:tRNA dimethylallyltransferase
MAKRARTGDSIRSGDTPVPTETSDDKSVVTPYYICGPTASGKSALALEMAEKLDGEIVNADAFQLYRGLEISAPRHRWRNARLSRIISTACSIPPKPPTRALHAHGQTRHRGNPKPRENAHRHRRLGLYLKFLTHGPAPLPTGDAKLRAELDARPLEDLVAELTRLDPAEAARTALQNRRFVSRALEICLLTGQKASDLRDQWETKTREISANLRGS